VSALGRSCVRNDIPDVAFVTLRFASGAVAECQLSWLSPVKLRRTMVVGSKKMLLYDDTEPAEKIKLFDHGVNVVEPESFGEFQLSYRTGDIVSPHIDPGEPLQLEASHFAECVINGMRPRTDGRSGLRVVRALERAQASLDCESQNRRSSDRGYSAPTLAGQLSITSAIGSIMGGTL
jgi:predicted dehydrogenase